MLLVIDIGNTNIVFGLYNQGLQHNTKNEPAHKWRMISDVKKSSDDYAIDIIESLVSAKFDVAQISACIIGSVVPKLSEILQNALAKFFAGKILVVGSENVKLNIEITLPNKKEIGADRLINAIASYEEFGGNLVIVDFGTATTFDVVGAKGEYLGGIIAPGINLSLKALHDMTAQLPQISLQKQKNVIGKNTVEAMNSGVYFGYLSLVEGMLKKIENELNHKITCITTGGLAEIFNNELQIKHYRPNLTLEGLLLIYEQNK